MKALSRILCAVALMGLEVVAMGCEQAAEAKVNVEKLPIRCSASPPVPFSHTATFIPGTRGISGASDLKQSIVRSVTL